MSEECNLALLGEVIGMEAWYQASGVRAGIYPEFIALEKTRKGFLAWLSERNLTIAELIDEGSDG